MSKIEVVYDIWLAHPVMWLFGTKCAPIVTTFPETENTVHLSPPDASQIVNPNAGTYHTMKVRVEREGEQPRPHEWESFKISEDAGRAFFALFDMLRRLYYDESKAPGYPVVPSMRIEQNPLVARWAKEWRYDGELVQRIDNSGMECIEISDEHWEEARDRLASGEEVPAYISFTLDAIYFAMFDPVRAVIMANSAWETALRYYLANVAGRRDAKFIDYAERRQIPDLISAIKEARGGQLFFEWVESNHPPTALMGRMNRQIVCDLPTLRNRLVHRGITPSDKDAAHDSAVAVMYAIDWLFADPLNQP